MIKRLLSLFVLLFILVTALPAAVSADTNVAEVNGTPYASLQDALVAAQNAAQNGETVNIKLLSDIAGTDNQYIDIPEGMTVILDLNGYALIGRNAGAFIKNHGNLTVNDESREESGRIYTTNIEGQGRCAVENYGTLIINSGTFGDKDTNKTNANDVQRGNAIRNYGTATINGGNFTACDNFTNGGYAYVLVNGGKDEEYPDAVMTIKNATVYGNTNGMIAADGGRLIVEGGIYTLGDGTADNLWRVVYTSGNGEVEISGGTFCKNVAGIDKGFFGGSGGVISVADGSFEDKIHENVYIDSGKVSISGGSFENGLSKQNAAEVEVSGGTFSQPVPDNLCADGFTAEAEQPNGTYGVASIFSEGDGTENTPFIISSLEQLKAFRNSVNNGQTYKGKYISLEAGVNYDLSGEEWVPIGNNVRTAAVSEDTRYFGGCFDGKNAVITGLQNGTYAVTGEELPFGLFGLTHNAVIKNIKLAEVQIDAAAGDGVGALIGQAIGTLELSHIEVQSGSISGSDGVGGIVGRIYGTETIVSDCINRASVSSAANNSKAGGISSIASSALVRCTFKDCENYGMIQGSNAGGMMGYAGNQSGDSEINFENCNNCGEIDARQSVDGAGGYAGGIVGYDSGSSGKTINYINCVNEGNVFSDENDAAGGITGYAGDAKERGFKECSNKGDITGGSDAGGIVGSINGGIGNVITRCTVTDHAVIAAVSVAGGIVGTNGGELTVDGCMVADTVDLRTSAVVTDNADSVWYGYVRGVAVGKTRQANTIIKNMSDYGEYELVADIYDIGTANEYTFENCVAVNPMRWFTNSSSINLHLVNSHFSGIVMNKNAVLITADENSSVDELVAGAKYDYQKMTETWTKIKEHTSGTVTVAANTALSVSTAEQFQMLYENKQFSGTINGTDTTSYLKIGTGNDFIRKGLYQWNTSSWKPVAKVNEQYYTDLAVAVSAASGNGAVTLMADFTGASVTIDQAAVIVKNGFTASVTAGVSVLLAESDDAYIFTAKPDDVKAYSVKYEQQNVEDDGYTEVIGDTVSNVSGAALTSAFAKVYEGFYPAGTELDEDAAIYTVRFNREHYNAVWKSDGTTLETVSVKYGATVPAFSGIVTKEGYILAGWSGYTDGMTMPANDVVFTAQWKSDTSSSGSSGSSARSIVISDKIEHGSITVSPKNSASGRTVTITVKPEDGYRLDTLTVVDADGKKVQVTRQSDGSYTFIMPASKVTVTAVFAAENSNGCLVPENCPVSSFRDLNQNAWYHEAVDYAVLNGFMNGLDSEIFDTNGNLSRAMMAQILYNMEEKPSVLMSVPEFEDVDETAWYAPAVNWIAVNGIASGYGDGRFGAEDFITREQMAVILYNYAEFKGYDITTGGMAIREFADYASISEWAAAAMDWAVESGLFSGRGGEYLDPTFLAARSEAAQIMMNFCEEIMPQ